MDLTFFEDNYVIIIVIAVVLVMTIIGYFADKKGFGTKKDNKNKKVNNKESDISNEEIKEETNEMSDNGEISDVEFEPPVDINPVEDSFENIETSETKNDVNSTDEVKVDDWSMDQAVEPEVEPIPDSQPIENTDIDNLDVESDITSDNNVENSDNEISETESVQEESNEVIDNTNNDEVQKSDTDEYDLPTIDKVNDEIGNIDDDEDVWKF